MNHSEAGKKGYWKTKEQLKAHTERQRLAAQEKYEANPRYCLNCNTRLPYEKRYNRFCNQSCAASHNNRGVTRHIKGSKVCQCGNAKKSHNKYCTDCSVSHAYHRTVNLEDAKSDRVRRRILVEQRGHQCEVCELSEWMGKPIPIELDHIDGQADNNSAENLRLICPNCHAQTGTYKGANAGKNSSRQKMRRRRYANGQTY